MQTDSTARAASRGSRSARATKIQVATGGMMNGILTGRFSQGELLDLHDLADEFRVSLAVMKQAIKELESKGLLKTVRGEGVRVAVFDRERYLGVLETVNILEAAATGLASKYLTDEDLAQALELNDRMSEAHAQDDLAKFSEASIEFHRILFSACPNEYLNSLLDDSSAHLAFLRGAMYGFAPMRAIGVVHEHSEIVEAILLRKSPAVIEAMMRRHRDATIDVLRSELLI